MKFKALNNKVEYEAAILALRIAIQLGAKKNHLFTDSRLLTN